MRYYVDSDVLIWHLRGDKRATRFLRKVGKDDDVELWTGALQRAEVLFFARKHEREGTSSFLSRFRTEPVTAAMIDAAATFFWQYHPSHSVDVNDCIFAAAAASSGGKLYTLNVKHFPMREVRVAKAF